MNVVLQSHGETLRLRINTLPVLLMNYQWSREQKWNRVRVSTESPRTFRSTHFPKAPKLRYLEDKNDEGFLSKTR